MNKVMVNKTGKLGSNKVQRASDSTRKILLGLDLSFRKQGFMQAFEKENYSLTIIFQKDKDSNKCSGQ